jgi:Uma2 family endonuclease
MHMATRIKRWTLEELHSLPDDGNKYELVDGELFVTPAPTPRHETILANLSRLLVPYVSEHQLGMVYHPRSVIRFEGSEAEPDLMVRARLRDSEDDWEHAPVPLLVVEVLSPYTRRRDLMQKREFYLAVGVGEYWIVDPDDRSVRVIRRGVDDIVTSGELRWFPDGARAAFECRVAELFDAGLA